MTYNRIHLLEQCVENVLLRTSSRTTEIVIWNNASTDRTNTYLDSIGDERFHVVHHDRNIGQSAYARAFRLTRAPYMIELDDDIIDACGVGRDSASTPIDAYRRSAFSRQTSSTTRSIRLRRSCITPTLISIRMRR